MNVVRVIINLFQFNRTNWKAVILCLMAATIFWLFNSFNKSHSSTIRFPLRFEYDHDQFVAVSALPHQIRINVTGTGWDLLRKTFGVKVPEMVIPLDRPLDIKKIPATSLVPVLMSQLGNLQINFIAVDTLHIQLDKRGKRTFHLGVDLKKVNFKEGFGNTGAIHVMPDTVTIDGPQSVISRIPDTILLPLKTEAHSKTFSEEVEVPLFNSETINRNPPVVTVMIETGPIEIIETELKVNLLNSPSAFKSQFADSVKVQIQIPAIQKENFMEQMTRITASIDFKQAKSGSYAPDINGLPIYARVISIDSLSSKID